MSLLRRQGLVAFKCDKMGFQVDPAGRVVIPSAAFSF
jgi:hypothetical protein